MTGKLSKNFHGGGIGPLSKIYAVKYIPICKISKYCFLNSQNFWKWTNANPMIFFSRVTKRFHGVGIGPLSKCLAVNGLHLNLDWFFYKALLWIKIFTHFYIKIRQKLGISANAIEVYHSYCLYNIKER